MDRNECLKLLAMPIMVALRKESVDRNGFGAKLVHSFLSSLSARRAWIEILICFGSLAGPSVALRKESVDRNYT